MAYTAPPTFVAGDPLAAAELNVLGDDIKYLYAATEGLTFSGCSVTRAADTSIPDTTETAITFTAEGYDYGAWWASGPDVVVPAGAIPAGFTTIAVQVIGRTKFAGDNLGFRQLAITLNGTAYVGSNVDAVDGGDTEIVVADFAMVAAGDTIGVSIYQTAGHAINVAGTKLTVVRFAPAA